MIFLCRRKDGCTHSIPDIVKFNINLQVLVKVYVLIHLLCTDAMDIIFFYYYSCFMFVELQSHPCAKFKKLSLHLFEFHLNF